MSDQPVNMDKGGDLTSGIAHKHATQVRAAPERESNARNHQSDVAQARTLSLHAP
jgi:hypothetical protein